MQTVEVLGLVEKRPTARIDIMEIGGPFFDFLRIDGVVILYILRDKIQKMVAVFALGKLRIEDRIRLNGVNGKPRIVELAPKP